MIDRYGESIEADFHRFYQLDLLDWFRVSRDSSGRGFRRFTWRKLRSLLDKLPEHSATNAARANDDESVAEYMEHVERNPELKKRLEEQGSKPPLEGYTREARKLDQLSSDVRALIGLVNSALNGKMKIPDVVVPESAADRWRRRRSERKMSDLIAEVQQAQARWKPPSERKSRV